jgi:putative colanic acid biosynthesis acetyltransferase WcaF
MKVDLASYNNNHYKPGPFLKRGIWYIVNLFFFKTGLFPLYGLKVFLLRLFGCKIGNGVFIKPNVNIKYPWKLTIGDHVWIGEGVWIDNLDEVSIGNNVCISQGALLLCGNHNYTKSTFDLITKPIILEDGVWIGAKSIIIGGVTAKSHSVLTVNSVLSKNTEPFTIYIGNPAVKTKSRTVH